MQSEPSYDFSGTVSLPPDSVQISGRFLAPNRVDEMFQVQGQSAVRTVLVGSEVFVQDPTSKTWRLNRGTGSAPDPRAAFAVLLRVVSVIRVRDALRFSVPATLVGQLVPGLTASGPAGGSARLSGGTLTHLDIAIPSRNRPVTISLDYRALGAAPPVSLPPAAG
jgi:hypothetical protein